MGEPTSGLVANSVLVEMGEETLAPAQDIQIVTQSEETLPNEGGELSTQSVLTTQDSGVSYIDENGKLTQTENGAEVQELSSDTGTNNWGGGGATWYVVFAEGIEGGWKAVSLINTAEFYHPLTVILLLVFLLMVLEALVFFAVIYGQSERNLAIAAAREAESASRAKSQFLSQMSHEIRAPINAIIGLDTILLRDQSISGSVRESLEKISMSVHHLLSLINDILDMSRIESGRMELAEEEFSLTELLGEVETIIGGQCEDRRLSFVCEKSEDLRERYVGDALKLKQVMINVMGNSVKFTEAPGTVTLSVGQTPMPDGRSLLSLTMSDTGIGMDEDYIPRLFEAFFQEDTANTTKFGGSGLGMAITKNLVDMMGGEIWVESEKGVGTTFFVNMPLGVVPETAVASVVGEEPGVLIQDVGCP
ncbi:MAG: ATP-binding protein [Coriobacteriales bacterium]|nr:ATP-binding protein [Coriobacteriales bacterium]